MTGRNLSGTNLERAGDHNQRVTLHAIRVGGPVTRSDLALTTGLTAAAIAIITNRLLRQRLILQVESAVPVASRRPNWSSIRMAAIRWVSTLTGITSPWW